MIYLFSSGSYSDYSISAIVEGPSDGYEILANAISLYEIEVKAARESFYEKQRILTDKFKLTNPEPRSVYLKGRKTNKSLTTYGKWFKKRSDYLREHGALDYPTIKFILPDGFSFVKFLELHNEEPIYSS